MAFVLLLLSILPVPDGVLRDSCASLERNNFYDLEGRLVFTQLVAWENNGHCFFWRMAKDGTLPVERDHVNGGYVVRWSDDGRFREVRATSYWESWTQHDVEVVDREACPKEKRRELRTK